MARPRSLHDLLESTFGVTTTPFVNLQNTSIGSTATLVANINPRRVGLTFTNNGAVAIWLAPSRAVTTTAGIQLPAGGSSISLNWEHDFNLLTEEWFAITTAGAGVLFTLENVMNAVKGDLK